MAHIYSCKSQKYFDQCIISSDIEAQIQKLWNYFFWVHFPAKNKCANNIWTDTHFSCTICTSTFKDTL